MSPLARRSALVLGLLFGLVFAVGTGLMWYLDTSVYYAVMFAVVITLLQYAIGPLIIDWIFTIRWADPQEVSPEFADWYFATANEIGIPAPRFGIINDGNPNAFTYGRTRGDARVIITSGLVDILTPEELRGVVAHELGHVRNRDFIVMTVAQAVPLVLYVLYVWTRDRGRNFSYGVVISIGAYLVYLLSQFVVLSLSRVREFFADESSARITGDPNSLSRALIKISYGLAKQQEELTRLAQEETGKKKKAAGMKSYMTSNEAAALGIANVQAASRFALSTSDATGAFSETAMMNAMQWELKNPWAKWFQLNSTHPLTVRRVMAMNEASKQLGIAPTYALEGQKNPLQYTGDFLLELVTYALPVLTALAGVGVFASKFGIKGWYDMLAYGLIGFGPGWLIKTLLVYPRLNGELREVQDLVGKEINASQVSAVPCIIEGEIIGRGIPGLAWSDDLVLRDRSGFIYLQYRQPLYIFEFLFGWLKAENYLKRQARVYGWYRRAPMPYVEISRVEIIDGMRGNVRCYYRWGAYVFSVVLTLIGLYMAGLL